MKRLMTDYIIDWLQYLWWRKAKGDWTDWVEYFLWTI